MKTVSITIKVPIEEIENLLDHEGFTVKPGMRKEFVAACGRPRFTKTLARDILQVWMDTNLDYLDYECGGDFHEQLPKNVLVDECDECEEYDLTYTARGRKA